MFTFKFGWSFRNFLWLLFYILILAVLLKHSFSYLDPDFGWHLQVGQEISKTWSVPSLNQYNYTFTGNWVDHEWLSNFIIYEIYSHWGYISLSLIFALVVVLGFLLLRRQVRFLGLPGSNVMIAIFQFFGLLACSPHFGVRVQELGWLFLIILLLIIEKYEQRRRYLYLVFLIPVFYAWSCLHGSFTLGIFLLFAYLAVKIFEKIWRSSRFNKLAIFNNSLTWREIIYFTVFLSLALVATMLTPYGLNLYDFLGGYTNTFYLKHIQEWLPQYYYPFLYYQLVYLAVATLAFGLYLYNSWLSVKKYPINLWRVFLFIFFLGLAFKSRRHFPLFFVATFPLIIESYLNDLAIKQHDSEEIYSKIIKFFLAGGLICTAAAMFLKINFINQPFTYFSKKYPRDAVVFLRQNKTYSEANIFNSYGWGGYLIAVWPEKKLFIDGRLPQVKFAGQTFLEEYAEFMKKDADFAGKLKQYAIQTVLIQTKDPEVNVKNWEKLFFGINENDLTDPNYFRKYLEESPEWQVVYQDETSIIYFKK